MGMAPPGTMVVAGVELGGWYDMYHHCHTRISGDRIRTAWPNGGSYDDQPNIVVAMFDLISEVLATLDSL